MVPATLRLQSLAFVLLFAGVLSCGPSYRPPSLYTPEEQAAIDRAKGQAKSEQSELKNKELAEACDKARAFAGEVPEYTNADGAIASGTKRFATGCFSGKFQTVVGTFTKQPMQMFDQGVYVTLDRHSAPAAVFQGKFIYLSERTKGDWLERGTTIMIGRRTQEDGTELVGIFVGEKANDLYPGGPSFLLADKPYLKVIEEKHKDQVAQFNEEQRRKTQSERDTFNFGQAIALGLGGAVILGTGVNAGLPADDILQVAVAFGADVMTDGQAGAMDTLQAQLEAELEASMGGELGGLDPPDGSGSGSDSGGDDPEPPKCPGEPGPRADGGGCYGGTSGIGRGGGNREEACMFAREGGALSHTVDYFGVCPSPGGTPGSVSVSLSGDCECVYLPSWEGWSCVQHWTWSCKPLGPSNNEPTPGTER